MAQDKYVWEPMLPIKGIFGDISFGNPGLGIGAGGRYMMFGLNLGLVGITNTSPAYAKQIPTGVTIRRDQPLPNGYEEERFLSTMINVDAMFFLDWTENVSFNVSLGYYSANDSILAKNIVSGSRYIYRNEVKSGMCYGVGLEYVIHVSANIGMGYHTERGFVFRATYIWW
jgi:hypothetical protein